MTSGDTTLLSSAGLSWPARFSRVRLAMGLAVAFSILPVLGQFVTPLVSTDEILLLVYPEQWLAGRIPHVDFFTVYGPGDFGLLAAVFSITGPSVIAERAVGLLYHVVIATGVVRLTSPLGRIASCAAGVTSALVLLPLSLTAYAWLGGLALTVWSLALLTGSTRSGRPVLAGILGGLVAAWRIEMLVLLLATGPLLWKTKLTKSYLLGLAIGLAPTAAFLAVAGRRLLDNVFLSRMAVNAQLDLTTVPTLLWVAVVLSLVTTGALAITALCSSHERRATSVYAMLGALLLPQEMQRIDFVHIGFVMCVIAPLGVAYLLRRADSPNRARPPAGLSVIAGVTLAVLSLSALAAIRQSDLTSLHHEGRSTPVTSAERPRLEAKLRLVNRIVPAGSKIFVGASDMSVPTVNDVELYHLLPEYKSDAYFLELPPGVAEKRGSPLLNDILRADALILSDVPESVSEARFPNVGKGDDSVNRAVASHFCPKGRLPHFTVYLRCGAH